MEQKTTTQNKKISKLSNPTVTTMPLIVTQTVNVVIQATANLTQEEIDFLNLGCDFAVPTKIDRTLNIVTDIEAAIGNLPFVAK